ncbi:MAG: sigma-70 family RNA polymerase sigma factor [Actinobacteria bacterium]|nr:sigma-70 family RNA polymerase sigma factor [Actinomycetota bacterium]
MADKARFMELITGYMDALYTAAMRMTGNASDAEDLVQEAILRAYRGFHTFQEDTNLRAWLFRILTNTYISNYRSAKRHPETTGMDNIEDLYLYKRLKRGGLLGQGRSAEEEVLDSFTDVEIKEAIEGLPESFRIAVLLSDVEGFSYAEIAEITGVPIGTVMSRIYRGRKVIQKVLHSYALERGLVDGPSSDKPTLDVHTPDQSADELESSYRDGQLDNISDGVSDLPDGSSDNISDGSLGKKVKCS